MLGFQTMSPGWSQTGIRRGRRCSNRRVRGCGRAVAPGERVVGGYEATKVWRATLAGLSEDGIGEEEKRDVEAAFANFGLVVIEPVEVDFLEPGVELNRRTVFRHEGKGWVEEEVVL